MSILKYLRKRNAPQRSVHAKVALEKAEKAAPIMKKYKITWSMLVSAGVEELINCDPQKLEKLMEGVAEEQEEEE